MAALAPSAVAVYLKSSLCFGGNRLAAVVFGGNLDVDAPAAALDVLIFNLRVGIDDSTLFDG